MTTPLGKNSIKEIKKTTKLIKKKILGKVYTASVKKNLVTSNTPFIANNIATQATLPESSTINFEVMETRQVTRGNENQILKILIWCLYSQRRKKMKFQYINILSIHQNMFIRVFIYNVKVFISNCIYQ